MSYKRLTPTFVHQAFPATAGANQPYALTSTPITGSEVVARNGQVLRRTTDYTISGTSLVIIPSTSVLDAIYIAYQVT